MSALDMDATVRRSLSAVAGELQVTMASLPGWAAAEGATGVRGGDLQRALCNALQTQLGAVACVEGPLPEGVKDCWAGWLGRVDVLARHDEAHESYFETQLCGVDKLHESLWDALKLALFTALEPRRSGYLLYGAPESAWAREAHHPEAIFTGTHVSVDELLRERDGELWQWCLRGTRTTRPLTLPRELRSTPIASICVRAPSLEWQLRCVRIEGDPAEGWIDFDDAGWPLDAAEAIVPPGEALGADGVGASGSEPAQD
jgi:hypothetical protein